ncbi:MAG: hypothetical protein COZ80_01600 [Ignavibacteria bacterium CG_4_8_14_3_um_filter_37_9]|nr:MAG: hypothetical protein AUJ54_04485 [Ignavibacteria bacterium CG1_02_37_35]PIP77177.1 MAG: hypothetical protein COW85_10315 [Ignavibacteria bacterium CG22_combo_CG10-13_8_21_14_all_37_15]PIS46287.1 MAG: hypothetical protein COT22_00795 [Ignavibacteria bacterium CG08_land_8_20_14_0_20_37_9]PIX00151.1 MAG: hypothetical protein COZ80_01600 [Ignavibacteria bacterium CG_4_8_14_3_um_filter_37_9]PIX93080.1 MAG: hypothetical protein COZ25_12515 [Ignavibacteria bacterium CG_4_10_14_3_um_filter_37_1
MNLSTFLKILEMSKSKVLEKTALDGFLIHPMSKGQSENFSMLTFDWHEILFSFFKFTILTSSLKELILTSECLQRTSSFEK